MGLFARLLHRGHAPDQARQRRIGLAVTRIVGLNPRLRMARRCESRLEPAVDAALRYLDAIVDGIPPPREAHADNWSADPYIHAFFAAPEDIAPALSRSEDLRAFFQQYPDLAEAYGVLGMAMAEKHVLGVALEGETLRRDVVQETISFSDHQVRMCGRSEAELREEIVRRLVDQLAVEGLARFAGDQTRRGVLEQERALLKTRLLLLERQGVGMASMVGGELRAGADELERLRQQMNDNGQELEGLGMRSEALERQLDHLCEVLGEPAAHIYVERKRIRLNKMNVVLAANSNEAGDEITFEVARIPTRPPRQRAFALVRFPRAALLPAASLLDQAAKLLG
jgi:hypothetical protein